MTVLTIVSNCNDPWVDLPLATIDSWDLLLDERSMQELLQNEPELMNRIDSSEGPYRTQPGVWLPMPYAAFFYVLKSALGPEVAVKKLNRSDDRFQYKTTDGQSGIISAGSRDEFFITDCLVRFLESSNGSEGDWSMLRKLEKHIEDRRDQILEYRNQQFGPEPERKPSWIHGLRRPRHSRS